LQESASQYSLNGTDSLESDKTYYQFGLPARVRELQNWHTAPEGVCAKAILHKDIMDLLC